MKKYKNLTIGGIRCSSRCGWVFSSSPPASCTAANAGHEFPALRQTDGKFELFKDKHGFVIGGMKVVNAHEMVKEVFDVTGFADILTIE